MKNNRFVVNRRDFLSTTVGAMGLGLSVRADAIATPVAQEKPKPKSVAAIATVYRKNSHADVLIGKILEGWQQDGGSGPALKLASLYVDQVPDDDMSVKLAERHGFRLCKTIREAIELDSGRVAVDGVISIGEHGEYPWNDREQHLYPRRRFFQEITDAMEKLGRVVPIFNDKHPGPEWNDAQWMYDRAKKLGIPWMAGSSLPVSFRIPDVTLPMGSKLEGCIGIGYSGLDIYGFHTLDFLQCIIERRASDTTGVSWVQAYPKESIPGLIADQKIDRALLEAGLKSSGTDYESVIQSSSKDSAVFLIQYRDGLLAPVVMLASNAMGISAAWKVQGQSVIATRVEERPEPRYPHFAYLLKGIEQMIHSGVPAYPVERSLLTAGILDRGLTSRHEKGRRIDTPELDIQYTPVDYDYAPRIDLELY